MIALQTQIIETQQLKSTNQIKYNYFGLIKIINAIRKQIVNERNKIQVYSNNSTSLRSKQQVAFVRKQEIILRLVNELDHLLICIEEGNNLQSEFEKMRNKYSQLMLNFVQYTEERISVQKDKILMRMSGISKLTVDDMREENNIPRYTESHKIIYMIQSNLLEIVSGSKLPIPESFDPLFRYLLKNETDYIVVFNTLQFLEILCSQNIGGSNSKDNHRKDELQCLIHKLLIIISHAFAQAKLLWNESTYQRIPIFITQLFQTLNVLLQSLQQLGSEYSPNARNHIIQEDKETSVDNYGGEVIRNSKDNSSTKLYCWGEKYSMELLIEDIILWLKVFKVAKLHLLTGLSNTISMEIIQIINKVFKFNDENLISCSLINEQLRDNSQYSTEKSLNIKIISSSIHERNEDQNFIQITKDIIDLSTNIFDKLSEVLVIGCPIVINILQTVDKLFSMITSDYRNDTKNLTGSIPKLPAIPIFGSNAHTLLLAGLDLAALSCGKYAIRLGPQGSPLAVSLSDHTFLKAADSEISIGMQLANIAFSNGLWEMVAFNILQYGYEIVAHRSNSLLVSSSWLRCLMACTLCCLENDPPSNDDTTNAILHYINLNKLKLEGATSKDLRRRSSVESVRNQVIQLKSKDPLFLIPITTKFAKKSRIIYHLSKSVLRMLAVTASLKHILSIAHSGLILSRLLMRDLFLKRLEIEELVDTSLLPQLQPLINETAAKHQVDDDNDSIDQQNEFNSSQIMDVTLSTVHSGSAVDLGGFGSVSTAPMSANSIRGDIGLTQPSVDTTATSNSRSNSKSMPPSSDEYWKDWYDNNFHQIFHGETNKTENNLPTSNKQNHGVKNVNFIEVMHYIGESHLQCTEVIEQLLLFINHISIKSSLIRYTMIDADFSSIVQRIIDSQSNNLYMSALAELCLDTINA